MSHDAWFHWYNVGPSGSWVTFPGARSFDAAFAANPLAQSFLGVYGNSAFRRFHLAN